MSEIVVGNLRYCGDPVAATMVDSLVSDALRTTVHDDGRLVLVRRLALGRFGLSQGSRSVSERTEAAWRNLVGHACHGSSSSAASAECVWFHSSAEARTYLMRELAAGRPAFAWFWRLAVPDWHGQPLSGWLQERFTAAMATGDGTALLEMIEASLAANCGTAVSEAIAAVVSLISPATSLPLTTPSTIEIALGDLAESESEGVSIATQTAIRRIASTIASRLPSGFRLVLGEVSTRPGGTRLISELARVLLRRYHPEVLLDAALAEQAVSILGHLLADPSPPPHVQAQRDPVTPEPVEQSALPHAEAKLSPKADRPAAQEQAGGASGQASDLAEHLAFAPQPSPSRPDIVHPTFELATRHAGLFLAIPTLVRLGWREWLLQRPELLPLQPGSALLHHIARRHRVPPGDPLWQLLGEVEAENQALLEPLLGLWRRGLDGGLRRYAKLRLHDLVMRPGWVSQTPERLVVRFRLEAIDLALRRRALDSDPGWVDWLGLSLRYEFRDRALTGEHLS